MLQVVTELCKAVPPDHRAEINEQETKRPGNFVVYQVLQFDNPPVKTHAYSNFGGDPRYDFGWVRVGAGEPGGEGDPLYSPLKRVLVKFWGFTTWYDCQYAFVTFYTKEKAVWQLLQYGDDYQYQHQPQSRRDLKVR